MNKINLKAKTNNNQENITREVFDKFKKVKGAVFSFIQGEYDVVGGSISNSENIASETLLEKLFTGENSIIASWKNSRKLVLRPDFPTEDYENCIADNGDFSTCPLPNDLIKEYQIGDLEEFYIESVSYGVEQKTSGSAETTSRVKMFSKKPVDKDRLFDLRVFPELNDFFYRIIPNGAKEIKDQNGETFIVQYEFEKITKIKDVNDISQVIQLQSAVGEGYSWPKAIKKIDEEGNEYIDIVLDTERLKNTPVKYLQIDFDDPTAIASIWATGRPSTQGSSQGENFQEPRILAPSKFYQQDGNKIVGNVAPSDLFFLTHNARLDIQSSYSSWLEKIRSKYNDSAKKNWSGVLRDVPKITAEFSGSSIVDNLIDVNTNRPYWDQTRKTLGEDVLCLSQSPYVDLEEGFTISGGKDLRFEDWMTHNIFAYSHILTLPMQYSESAPFSLAKVGSILSAVLTGGIGSLAGPVGAIFASTIGAAGGGFIGSLFGFQNTKLVSADVNDLRLFIPGWSYTTLWNGIYSTDNPEDFADVLPIDFFSDTRAESMMGLGDSFTSMKMLLTDKYTRDDGATIKSTLDLGKDLNGDGVANEYWNGENLVLDSDEDTWFIDQIIIQAISKTNYIATYYDENNNPIQSTKGITTAKRTGNLRNWTTISKTSNWTTDIVVASQNGDPIIPIPPTTQPEVEVPLNIDVYTDKEVFNGGEPSFKINSQQDIDEYNAGEEIEVVLEDVLFDSSEYLDFTINLDVSYDVYVKPDIGGINHSFDENTQLVIGAANDDVWNGDQNKPSAFVGENGNSLNEGNYFYENQKFTLAPFNININRSNLGKYIIVETIADSQIENWTETFAPVNKTSVGLVNGSLNKYAENFDRINNKTSWITGTPAIYQDEVINNKTSLEIKLDEFDDGGFNKLKLTIKLNNNIYGTYGEQFTAIQGGSTPYSAVLANATRITPKTTINKITLKSVN